MRTLIIIGLLAGLWSVIYFLFGFFDKNDVEARMAWAFGITAFIALTYWNLAVNTL